MDQETLSQIEQALQDERLGVDTVADTFNVSLGTGLRASKANVDPRPLFEGLDDQSPEARRRQIAGFARGVKHVLLEPLRSNAAQWSFVESAGGLLPSIETRAFGLGVHAAAGEPVFALDFLEDLNLVYFIRLDRGLRVLTAPQVKRWAVSTDRITAGARSLLFHRTRDVPLKPFEDFDKVRRLHAGDGHDAARALVTADVLFTEIGDGFRFSIPTPEHFLCTADASTKSIGELRAATHSVAEQTDYPLTTKIFRFQSSKPVLAEQENE